MEAISATLPFDDSDEKNEEAFLAVDLHWLSVLNELFLMKKREGNYRGGRQDGNKDFI